MRRRSTTRVNPSFITPMTGISCPLTFRRLGEGNWKRRPGRLSEGRVFARDRGATVGVPVRSVSPGARKAKVSRSWLYNQSDLRRDRAPARPPESVCCRSAGPGSATRLRCLSPQPPRGPTQQNRLLEAENRQLREALAVALGEQRAAAHRGRLLHDTPRKNSRAVIGPCADRTSATLPATHPSRSARRAGGRLKTDAVRAGTVSEQARPVSTGGRRAGYRSNAASYVARQVGIERAEIAFYDSPCRPHEQGAPYQIRARRWLSTNARWPTPTW